MPPADSGIVRAEAGFTLVELIVVIVVMAILTAVAFGFSAGAREKAEDATARANLRTAIPAIESYRADTGGYAGMTAAVLQAQYSPGISGITVVSAGPNSYCVRADAAAWFKAGPAGPVTQAPCS